MTLSEALEAIGAMVDGSPYRSQAGDSYLGTMAKLIMDYPRQVAMRCADPLRGVARDTKFLPTVADVVAWCERATEPLRRDVDREHRVDKQIKARELWQKECVSDGLKEKGRAWLDRSDPVAAHLCGRSNPERDAVHTAATARLQEANRRLFERECARDGIDPAGGMSPTLLRRLGSLREAAP